MDTRLVSATEALERAKNNIRKRVGIKLFVAFANGETQCRIYDLPKWLEKELWDLGYNTMHKKDFVIFGKHCTIVSWENEGK